MSLKEYTKKLQIMVEDEVRLAECLFLGWGYSLVSRMIVYQAQSHGF